MINRRRDQFDGARASVSFVGDRTTDGETGRWGWDAAQGGEGRGGTPLRLDHAQSTGRQEIRVAERTTSRDDHQTVRALAACPVVPVDALSSPLNAISFVVTLPATTGITQC